MVRESILQHIFNAKKAHVKWVKRADYLISGLPIDKDFIPFEPTECGFGMWMYGEGAKLRLLEDLNILISKIEYRHNQVHDSYLHIYKLFFLLPKQRGIIANILTLNSKKPTTKDINHARLYFDDLQESSDKLLILLGELEKAVYTLKMVELDHIFSEMYTNR